MFEDVALYACQHLYMVGNADIPVEKCIPRSMGILSGIWRLTAASTRWRRVMFSAGIG
ncbi:MAG: hypothetical protein FWE00_01740 [Defluviitaleaceae bacterium]|nr:hypothetical protein [Defluviitaleaceae bacterium]